MSTYQIADLEKLTGIKAHTIRIWESRYKLIVPKRTPTNIRYYDDDQVRKLLNVSVLISNGYKISKIAELSENEINNHILKIKESAGDDVISLSFISELKSSMLKFDETSFDKTFLAAVTRFGMYGAILKVVYPFLNQTGLMWSLADAMPVQEHFATALIRRKLIAAIDGLPVVLKRSKLFLLFLPEGEWHETGLLLADYIIRSKGHKTVYLSQSVPYSNLDEVIKAVKPTHLLTFYITRQHPDKIHDELSAIIKMNPNTELLVAGNILPESVPHKSKRIRVVSTPQELVDYL